MVKAYVTSWREEPRELSIHITMEFDPNPQNAAIWDTQAQARNSCRYFEASPVTISGRGVCKGFEVEELAPRRFVIFCDYPSHS
jgi:hypothetical protein